MCKCKTELDRQIVVQVPYFIKLRYNTPEQELRTNVALDICLVEEIFELWKKGIVTTGHCCGHNSKTRPAYIGVEDEFIPIMKELGYKVQPNKMYKDREDGFIPMIVY